MNVSIKGHNMDSFELEAEIDIWLFRFFIGVEYIKRELMCSLG